MWDDDCWWVTFIYSEKAAKFENTVKLGGKERFDKEQIVVKEPFPATNLQFIHKDKKYLPLRDDVPWFFIKTGIFPQCSDNGLRWKIRS